MIKIPVQIEFWRAADFMKFMLSQAKTEEERQTLLFKNKDLGELHNCFPLFLRESLAKGKKMVIGKIIKQNHPFDVVIADENDWEKGQDKAAKSYSRLNELVYIQVKEITEFGSTIPMTLDTWLKVLQEKYINKTAEKISMQSEGVLYLVNNLLFNGFTWNDLWEGLKNLTFPPSYPYKQVVITLTESKSDSKLPVMHTWQIYPEFINIGSLTEAEIYKLKSIYGLD